MPLLLLTLMLRCRVLLSVLCLWAPPHNLTIDLPGPTINAAPFHHITSFHLAVASHVHVILAITVGSDLLLLLNATSKIIVPPLFVMTKICISLASCSVHVSPLRSSSLLSCPKASTISSLLVFSPRVPLKHVSDLAASLEPLSVVQLTCPPSIFRSGQSTPPPLFFTWAVVTCRRMDASATLLMNWIGDAYTVFWALWGVETGPCVPTGTTAYLSAY